MPTYRIREHSKHANPEDNTVTTKKRKETKRGPEMRDMIRMKKEREKKHYFYKNKTKP